MEQGLVVCLLILGFLGFICLLSGSHIVAEGHIGIYTRGGALLSSQSKPGLHFKFPLITRHHDIQVTVQTDKVQNIPCGTSSGVMIQFENIEVVNRLQEELAFETIKNYTIEYDKTWIFDKIHHEINQFCSSHSLTEVYITQFDVLDDFLQNALQEGCNQWAPGIEIISVRVTKPIIPRNLILNYEQRELSKAELIVQKERQKVIEKESETQKLLVKIEADTQRMLSEIQIQNDLLIQQGNQKISEIENEIQSRKEKSKTEAHYYKTQKRNRNLERTIFT
eukprot:TRINITY_DN11848_c0_g1_i1.p1 TRINITY_DN11848_c0_g1~~TRINITY_DN11848_c0_g1_i1.p1  ORF type:complete len:280 (-),score=42.29 TRINITY_DN11848_c0_g1_i1:269-1108(-)